VPTQRIEVPAEPGSPRLARRFITAHLGDVGCVDDVALLTSELVTNAVVHAGSAAGVTVTRRSHAVRVEVADHDTTRPRKRTPDDHGGRGLHLVETVADRWGVDSRATGKVVWFEIDVAR
jgi:anti-sigma regulatory factor (Ser/Thr protein kinase)